MSSSAPPSDAERQARSKDFSRESRLSFRKFAEHQLRQDFKQDAIEKCHEPIREFAECAQETGLLVVVKCRHKMKAVNECMAIYNSNEAFEKYKKEHADDLERRTIKSK
jgi:hypothetical protein